MEGCAHEEALEAVGSSVGEVGAEAIAADVLHALLIRERRDSAGREVFRESLVEEDEVGEAAADSSYRLLEGREG